MILFTVVFTICLLSMGTFQIALHIYDKQLYNESAKVLNLSSRGIEDELKKTEDNSFIIMADPNVQDNLSMIKDSSDIYLGYQATSRLQDILLSYAVSEDYISSIDFIDSKSNQFSVGVDTKLNKEKNKEILIEAIKHLGKNIWIEPEAGNNYLIAARVIRRTHNLSLDYLGLMVIRIDLNKLVRKVFGNYPNSSADLNLQIFSGKKNIFSSNQKLEWKDVKSICNNGNYGVKTIDNKKFFIAITQAKYSGWTYVNVIPYETIYKKIIFVRNAMLLIYAGVFIMALWFGLKFAENITKPVEILALKMKDIEMDDFQVNGKETIVECNIEEINELYRDFEMMVEKINTLIKENYQKQILLKDTQYKALQAQINPHFLYNTLDSINWMAKTNSEPRISMMVEALGKLLRSAVYKKDLITIAEEEKILENYITIQKIRFEERLDFQMNVENEIGQYLIPKLTLQPIVENAINYGLEQMTGVCMIRVWAEKREENIELFIQDNGPGMDPEYWSKLRTGEIKSKGSGIGLKNIDDRIKMLYGEEYGISISSEPGKGTRVIICLPIKIDEETV
jgi:two-component system sensor histidine kinase YesM